VKARSSVPPPLMQTDRSKKTINTPCVLVDIFRP
jgi:hypothetical protein